VKHLTATTSFASTHRDEAESAYLHGHTFFVSATETGESQSLLGDLEAVAAELHLRSLDDMLAGGGQGLDHMAAWFMERLLLRHPRMTLVEMWVADRPDVRVGTRRELR
jgi:hypothetical protein